MVSRLSKWAIFGVFFFEASVIGQWIPRIPDIKDKLGLSDSDLGLALLSMPLGTLVGFAIAGRIIDRIGLRDACRLFLPVWALLFITPALTNSFFQLALALFVCGCAIGLIETAMNTEAARLESAAGARLMSRCHGFWSLGTMFGALLGGFIAQQGVSVAWHYVVVLPIIALGGFWVSSLLPKLPRIKVSPSPDDLSDKPPAKSITIPSKAIILLCIMPLGIMMVEGVFIDWSAVFMRDVMDASPLLIAVTYAFFATIMAAVRLSGDAITERFGELLVVRFSAIAATVGIAMFALAPSTFWVFVAAAISGAGVAIVFPLAVTAAANRRGHSSADNIAALNMIAFSAFLIAPPLVGFLSEAIGLRMAFLALAPLAFMTFLLSNEVKPRN